LKGLSAPNKSIPSKYFYDDRGSQLFQEIMKLPEYYLTDCELNIFHEKKDLLHEIIRGDEEGPFELIELGAGDGTKTEILLQFMVDQQADFKYIPVDISKESNQRLYRRLKGKIPELSVLTLSADYFSAMEEINRISSNRKVVLFLGSNIGNFDHHASISFFKKLGENLHPGDMLIIGFDLIKDPRIILDAYNDPKGVTREFNLNLLERMNRELGANFNRDKFLHFPLYDPETAAAMSYLVSCEDQTVYFQALDHDFNFRAWELIFMEISRKYDTSLIHDLAAASGFEVTENIYDNRMYYTDSVWKFTDRS
jgi:dimethylhistidine N-methyltransferase